MINTYVQLINEAIKAKSTNFRSSVFGIAENVISQNVEVPYITVNGEDTHVFIDDEYDFGCYHKQKQITYTEDLTKGFGENKKILETQELALIAWGFTNKLTAEEFKDYFLSIAPEFVRFVSVSFDKKIIFNNEFKKVDYMVNESIFLIQINYKVQYKINKTCIEINPKFNN